jgi:inorganic pyrophosphatase
VVDVEGWGDLKEALTIIDECTERYNKIENKPADLFKI